MLTSLELICQNLRSSITFFDPALAFACILEQKIIASSIFGFGFLTMLENNSIMALEKVSSFVWYNLLILRYKVKTYIHLFLPLDRIFFTFPWAIKHSNKKLPFSSSSLSSPSDVSFFTTSSTLERTI